MHRVIAFYMLVISGMVCAEETDLQLTPEEHVALRAAESEGLAIYRHDRAAWLATDALLENRKAKKDGRVAGWVTEDIPGGLRVTFVGAEERKAPFLALYRTTVMDSLETKPVKVIDPPEELSAFERNAIAARDAALRSRFQACSPNYNSVVLPPRGKSKEWTVFMLPGTTENGKIPAGGTHRFMIDPDNASAMTSRTYTKSCIILDNSPDAVSLMITHLLDPTPTEAHVFWSLSARKELMVITPQGAMWKVNGAEIELIERSAGEG